MMKPIAYYTLMTICMLGIWPSSAHADRFADWLEDTRSQARNKGISEETIQATLKGVSPNPKVLKLDRKQPESTKTFEEYMKLVINQQRKDKAVREYQNNKAMLDAVSSQYGVQPEYIVALWAIESNFGERMGKFSIIRSLATLAYDGRRSAYFKKELFNAMKIIDQGHISASNMVGSWAGAMGQCQFMPSSFLSYAKDGNGDGRKDIWGTRKDVFASIANYLSSVGWDGTIGSHAVVRGASKGSITSYKDKSSLRAWNQKGITPTGQLYWDAPVALVSGNHNNQGPYFLVSKNYDNILKWNRSRYFALAVGTLADHIRHEAP